MASNTKFTPGPWLLEMNNVHTGSIASVHHCTDGWADIWSDKWMERGMTEEVMDANARLIAAAPEMFEALMRVIADGNLDDIRVYEEVRNALAKARGEA